MPRSCVVWVFSFSKIWSVSAPHLGGSGYSASESMHLLVNLPDTNTRMLFFSPLGALLSYNQTILQMDQEVL